MSDANLNELYKAVGRIEGKLDGLDNKVTEGLKNSWSEISDLGKRTSTLETNAANMAGKSSVLALIVSAAGTIGFWLLQKLFK